MTRAPLTPILRECRSFLLKLRVGLWDRADDSLCWIVPERRRCATLDTAAWWASSDGASAYVDAEAVLQHWSWTIHDVNAMIMLCCKRVSTSSSTFNLLLHAVISLLLVRVTLGRSHCATTVTSAYLHDCIIVSYADV